MWSLDGRPGWAATLVFRVEGEVEAGLLEAAIAATGKTRWVRVRFTGGEVQVVMLVKGADDVDATVAALAVLDSGVRQVPGLALGELLAHGARPITGGDR